MLFDPRRHELLAAETWDADIARATIAAIADDSLSRYSPEALWPPHPLGLDGGSRRAPFANLDVGAAGVIFTLDWLARAGAPVAQRDFRAVIDDLLIAAGELVWAAGPLVKGAGLCHGTAGNGYAFLKLWRRTAERLWLERARAFAMHAVAQSERQRHQFGMRHYSLWTGDIGLAIYLWNCVTGGDRWPVIDHRRESS